MGNTLGVAQSPESIPAVNIQIWIYSVSDNATIKMQFIAYSHQIYFAIILEGKIISWISKHTCTCINRIK